MNLFPNCGFHEYKYTKYNLGITWAHFIILEHVGTMMVIIFTFLDYLEIILGSCWDHVGIGLGSVWDNYGIILGSV